MEIIIGTIVSRLILMLGKYWAEQTPNKYDDQVVTVIAAGLEMNPLPLIERLKEQSK